MAILALLMKDLIKGKLKAQLEKLKAQLEAWADNPESLRHLLRDSEPGQIFVCVLLGFAVGLITLFLHVAVLLAHQLAFGLESNERLSSAAYIEPGRIMLVPVLGGLVIGLWSLASKRWKNRDVVDPIEANAIYGGKMSWFDSLRLLIVNTLSNFSGASVGMEAAFTQVGAGFFSSFGAKLKLRRQDMRVFVAAGTAAAISSAFNAPLAGAFYGFELILGSYSISSLSQVSAASLAAALIVRGSAVAEPVFNLPLYNIFIPGWNYPLYILLGIGASVIGIITMKSVTECERMTSKLKIPGSISPIIGGLMIAVIALFFPQVLGSGQGAIDNHLHVEWALIPLAFLLLAKIAASAISIGTGFRGGLFSSSLFIGCIFGQMMGIIAVFILPESPGQMETFILVGMASTAASIIGAPVTMTMLILEMTGNFEVTTAVLAGVLVSSAITRYYFGYSFSTWRFHLRGLRIAGAHDIGWIKDLSVEKLMRHDAKTARPEISLEKLRTLVPAGSAKRIFVADSDGSYRGIIAVNELHDQKYGGDLTAASLTKWPDKFLLPEQDIKHALKAFTDFEMEALPVLQSEHRKRIIGYLTEDYTLRRYTQELEQNNFGKI